MSVQYASTLTACMYAHWTFPPLHGSSQVRWTKTAGSASDKFQETSIYNETLRIEGIQRVQGGRYYCKADNGVERAAIKSIRVDVQCKWKGWKDVERYSFHFQMTTDSHCSYSHCRRRRKLREMERLRKER